MIDKIYDINGVAHKVQAAGTVYNEELNSLAFGSGTSAIGRDQIAFGCNNIPDANKVEVVGGGEVSDSGAAHLSIDITSGQNYKTFVFLGHNITEATDYMLSHERLLVAETIPEGYTNNDIVAIFARTSSPTNPYMFDYFWFVMKDGKWFFCYHVQSAQWYDDVRYENGVAIMYEWREVSSLYDPTLVVNDDSVYKNIRTLDWEGNETLAGGLSIGGSLKVGNTILTEAQLTALLALIPSNS